MELNEKIYLKIAETLNEIIPIEWENIYLYSEIEEGAVIIYFYFTDSNNRTLFQAGDIHKKLGGSRKMYKLGVSELSDYIEALNKNYLENNQEKWTCITYLLNHTGKVRVDFGYEDLYQSDITERRELWEKKYLPQ